MKFRQHTKRIIKRVARLFATPYFVFGDSHCEVFQYLDWNSYFKRYSVILVGGATAQGMRNPNSKTNALQIFDAKISGLDKKSNLIFQLGEVDTGFVIWYRAAKYNEEVQNQLNMSVKTYFQFIDDLIKKGFHNITIVSAPLPTIEDDQDWGEVANARKEIVATKRERTDLTLRYNRMLKENCRSRNLKFIDCDLDLLDNNTMLIHERFKNKDRLNHHLDLEKYASVIKKYL